jgi:hypothetical protein
VWNARPAWILDRRLAHLLDDYDNTAVAQAFDINPPGLRHPTTEKLDSTPRLDKFRVKLALLGGRHDATQATKGESKLGQYVQRSNASRRSHIEHTPEAGYVGQVLCPTMIDLHAVQAQNAYQVLQKAHFLARGLYKSEGKIRECYLEGQAGKARTCAQVQQTPLLIHGGRQRPAYAEGIQKMKPLYLLRFHDSGEIGTAIPGSKLPQIDCELLYLPRSQFDIQSSRTTNQDIHSGTSLRSYYISAE